MGTVNMSEAVNLISQPVSGLILAGGEGRRMSGRDKGLITLANKPLIEYAIACLSPLVDDLTISCNRNQEQYADYQLPCVLDSLNPIEGGNAQFAGPMAGLVAGLGNARHDWLLVMPCDTPLMNAQVMLQLFAVLKDECNNSLHEPLSAESKDGTQAIIFSYQGLQPLHGLYHKSMLPIFNKCLAENKNALHKLLNSMSRVKIIEAKDAEYRFNNANDLEELNTIEGLIETLLTT